jgi:hypothetical protein
MVHLLAAIATDPEHMPALLYALKGAWPAEPSAGAEAWGIGYYADDQALTIRKPGELVPTRSFFELGQHVRSRVILAAHETTEARPQGGVPHRFRRWLFGADGDLGGVSAARARIVEALPDFLRSELSSSTASELAFGVFLRELHQKNVLGDPLADGPSLSGGLKRAQAALGMLAAEAGGAAPSATLVASNGRTLLLSRPAGASPAFWRVQEGLELPPDWPRRGALVDDAKLAEGLKRFRAVVFSAGGAAPPGWSEVAEGATLWVDRTLTVNQLVG